jgi:hypothetical protein
LWGLFYGKYGGGGFGVDGGDYAGGLGGYFYDGWDGGEQYGGYLDRFIIAEGSYYE